MYLDTLGLEHGINNVLIQTYRYWLFTKNICLFVSKLGVF